MNTMKGHKLVYSTDIKIYCCILGIFSLHIDHMRNYKCDQLQLGKWVINSECAVLRYGAGKSCHISRQSCENL